MRSAVFVGFAVFLFVAVSGYCINWYIQSTQAKHALEQAIANINATQKIISYDAIETSGFPRDVRITVVKPHIAGRLDQLIAAAEPQRQGTPLQWETDITLNGSITFGVNAFSDHYTMTTAGDWQGTNRIDNQTVSIATQSAGVSICALDLAHEGGLLASLWNFRPLVRDGEQMAKDFRTLDCAFGSYSMINSQTQEKLLTSGGGRLYVTHEPTGASRKMRVYMKLEDTDTTEAGSKLMTGIMQEISPNAYSPSFAVAGRQNAEIDFSYNGPASWDANAKDAPMDIYLSKFTFNNPFYNANATLHVTDSATAEKRDATLNFKGEESFSEPYDAMVQASVHNFISQCAATAGPQCSEIQPMLLRYKPDDLFAMMIQGIPNFHSLGKLSQSVDAVYAGSPNFQGGDLAINTLQLAASTYSLSAQGAAKTTPGQLFPAANLSVACTDCAHLIDDTTGYAMRLQRVVMSINSAPPGTLTPEWADGFKKFAVALSVPKEGADASTYNYAIVSGASGISVNGKPLDQVMALYNQYCGKQGAAH